MDLDQFAAQEGGEKTSTPLHKQGSDGERRDTGGPWLVSRLLMPNTGSLPTEEM